MFQHLDIMEKDLLNRLHTPGARRDDSGHPHSSGACRHRTQNEGISPNAQGRVERCPLPREFMKLAIVFIAVMIFSSASPLAAADSRPKEPLKLKLGLGSAPAPPLPNSVLWLAKDLGFYQREGLDVELTEFQGTPLAIAAMIAGEVDVANVSTSEVIRMTATKGQPMRAIHSPDARLYFLLCGPRRNQVGQRPARQNLCRFSRIGSVDHSLSMLALKSLGFNPAGLKLIAMGVPSTRAQALVAGRVDATITFGWHLGHDPERSRRQNISRS